MKRTASTFAALLICGFAFSQGCIPVRNLVGFGQFIRPQYDSLQGEPTNWVVNVNSRYYEAYQMFNGTSKVQQDPFVRAENKVFIMNFSVSRMFGNGWSYTIDIPISSSSRSSSLEHDTTSRHTTSTFGLGDIRVTAYKWLLDVTTSHRGNIQLGLGIKLPTGDYRYEDFFHRKGGMVSAPVNQTIQLGDGGTGFTLEVNSFYNLSRKFSLYGNLFYLFNPRDHNGVSNMIGLPGGKPAIAAGATVNSVPDSYAARIGANFTQNQFTIWTGLRMEGAPVHDVFGGSNGQRRAGMIISVDPGFNYSFRRTTVYAFVPLPIYRTTYQTVPDQALNRPSPGGFANYSVFIGALFRF